MAGKGPAPSKDAKRRNIEGKWSVVDWSELVGGGSVPGLPSGDWSPEAEDFWEALWVGPLRDEFLPQHIPIMSAALRCAQLLSLPEVQGSVGAFLKVSAELRMLSDRLGLDPSAIRRMRIDVKKPEKSGREDPPAVKSKAERRARVRAVDAG